MPELVRVSACDNPQRRGDVIFVHGLNGDPRDYWGGPTSYWPAWLGEELPEVGVWSLGYENAAFRPRTLPVVRFFFGCGFAMPLVDRVRSVLLRLEVDGIGWKPLVFVTHSMGGLLVKQLLRTANESPTGSQAKTLIENTKGVCFIATPHIGSDLAKWVSYFGTLLGTTVAVDELRPHLSLLRDLTTWYRDFVQSNPIKTLTFYEMKSVPPGIFVVEPGDADPGVPLAGLYPLDDDHRTICKPKSKQAEIHLKTVEFMRVCLSLDDAQCVIEQDKLSPSHQLPHYDENLKVSLTGGGAATSIPPFGTGEPIHLEIRLTIANVGQFPVFIVSAELKDASRTRSINFSEVCSEDEPLQPGGRRRAVRKLLYHDVFPPHPHSDQQRLRLKQENTFAFTLLRFICQAGSRVEVQTGRGNTLTYSAVEVCDEHFQAWPFIAAPEDIEKELGSKSLEEAERKWPQQPVARRELPTMAASFNPPGPIEVFFSYAHEDEPLLDELRKHLGILKRLEVIHDWHDRKITAGTEWKGQIDHRLDTAAVILLLVSADFVASDYCWDVELKRALERHDRKEARVIPVILRHVDNWHDAPFGKLQAAPTDGKAVTLWTNRDEAFANVAGHIRKAVEELRNP